MMPTLYDAYNRPVDFDALRLEQAAPEFIGVRSIYAVEHPEIGLTPNKLAGILRQAEMGDPYFYFEVAEAMEEKDLHYYSVLHTRKAAVNALEISVQAASAGKEDVYAADLVREVLIDGECDLPEAFSDILDALGKGVSATEIIWDTQGEQWYPTAFKWRDPRWFWFDWISGEQLLVRSLRSEGKPFEAPFQVREQQTPTGGTIGIQPGSQPLAPFKFITHFGKAKSGLPIRGGLARIAAWAYLFKNYVLKDWVTFAEIYGQPYRVGKYGPGATAADKSALLRAVASIGTDAAGIIPDSMLIEFVQSQTRASVDLYERLCDFVDRQMSKGILGQTLTTELPKGGGSRAAAQVHQNVAEWISRADGKHLASSANRDVVRPIVELNIPGPHKHYPKLTIGFPDQDDLKEFSDSVTVFIDRGMQVSEKQVRDKFGLQTPSEGERVLHPLERIAVRDSEDAAEAPASPTNAATAADDRPTEAAAIERIVESLADDSLLARMRQAKSYDELRATLAAAVQEMDLDKFVALMKRAGISVHPGESGH